MMEKFEKLQKIGSGGFGEVWEVKRTEDNITFACKEFNPNHYDDKDIKRFEREIQFLAKSNHKNIVPLIDFSLDTDPPYFIMPKAEMNLDDYLKKNGYGEKNIWIIKELLEGLKYAHDTGVTHRDLKPQNILLFKDELNKYTLKIGDFGLCKDMSSSSPPLTPSNIGMGTELYSAPEQFHNLKNVDKRSDIFSCGKIIYEILTGDCLSSIIQIEKIPNKFQHIVKKACSTNPSDRYQNIDLLIREMDIVTMRPEDTTPSTSQALTLILQILFQQYKNENSIIDFIKLVLTNVDEYNFRNEIILRIPFELIRHAYRLEPDITISILRKYDDSLEVDFILFSDCDKIANFYKNILSITNNYDLKCMIIKRLYFLGKIYNRYYVGKVFASVVDAQLKKDQSLLVFISELLNNNPKEALWNKEYLIKYSLPPLIKEALDKLVYPDEEDYSYDYEFEQDMDDDEDSNSYDYELLKDKDADEEGNSDDNEFDQDMDDYDPEPF